MSAQDKCEDEENIVQQSRQKAIRPRDRICTGLVIREYLWSKQFVHGLLDCVVFCFGRVEA